MHKSEKVHISAMFLIITFFVLNFSNFSNGLEISIKFCFFLIFILYFLLVGKTKWCRGCDLNKKSEKKENYKGWILCKIQCANKVLCSTNLCLSFTTLLFLTCCSFSCYTSFFPSYIILESEKRKELEWKGSAEQFWEK